MAKGARRKSLSTEKRTAESAGAAPKKMPVKIPQPHGGALNSGGTPGNKGGGRPPNWLKEWCDELLAKQENKAQVEAVLGDASHPAYAQMWRAVAERAHGKPVQPVQTEGKQELTVRVVHE